MHLIFETITGSTAYNLARAGSDIDRKGVIVGPAAWYFGHRTAPTQINHTTDWAAWELRRYIALCEQANPTALELLWTPERHHQKTSPQSEQLLANRDLFLTRQVAETFGRYAAAQLRRIRTHRSWLLDPPKQAPTRAQYGLPERTVIPADQLASVTDALDRGDLTETELPAHILLLLDRERRYKAAQKRWRSWQQWQANRNPQRSQLEAKHGYDTKHAMHLVRLARMAEEALTENTLHVHRQDRDELLAIRDGALTFEQLETTFEQLEQRIEHARQNSSLPERCDSDAAEQLCVTLIQQVLT